jgi:hypothetical protein
MVKAKSQVKNSDSGINKEAGQLSVTMIHMNMMREYFIKALTDAYQGKRTRVMGIVDNNWATKDSTRVVYCFFTPPLPVSVNYRHWPVGILVYHFGITVHVIFCLSYGFH